MSDRTATTVVAVVFVVVLMSIVHTALDVAVWAWELLAVGSR